MKGRITVEAPTGSGMTARESSSFMSSWWRVLAYDGSTVAYVPDKSTADFIASVLNAKIEAAEAAWDATRDKYGGEREEE